MVGDLSVLPALAESARPALATMGRLAAGARRAGVLVAHLTYLPLAGGTVGQPPLAADAGDLGDGSSGARRTPPSRSSPRSASGHDDLVLPRHQGISPVHRTEVLAVLRNIGITESSWPASRRTWPSRSSPWAPPTRTSPSTIPTDACIGTPPEHHASMLRHSLAFVARLTTTDELLAEWSAA